MKNRLWNILVGILLLAYTSSTYLDWFGTDGINNIQGIKLISVPLFVLTVILIIVGISSKYESGPAVTIGGLFLIIVQIEAIYDCIVIGITDNPSISTVKSLTHPEAIVSFSIAIAIITAGIAGCFLKRKSKLEIVGISMFVSKSRK